MSPVGRNIIANVTGKGWAALLSLAVIPLYAHFLGIEAFGLIGFFLSLTAILSLLDLGLGTALNRQFAQYSMQPDKAQEMRDLLRTLEIIYWLIGIAVGVTVAVLAPAIAAHWLRPQQLSAETVARALAMMGVAIALQWPRALYVGGLMGIQRQVALNALASIMVTANNLACVLIVWLVSPTIEAYLASFMAVSLADTLLTGLLLWRRLPQAPSRAAFKGHVLLSIWRFAAGMTGISIASVIFTQLDKVILVKVLPLDAFGYYSLASRAAGGLSYFTSPICSAFFPRLSQLASSNKTHEITRLYHLGCQLISVLVIPLAIVVALFSHELLLVWTQDHAIADNAHLVLSLLTVGTALNAIASMPHVLQLAHGWTRLAFAYNFAAILALAPLIYFMSVEYGGVGAAMAWVILNALYIGVVLTFMHKRLLRGELWTWYLRDVGQPLFAAAAVGALFSFLMPAFDSAWLGASKLALTGVAAFAAAIFAAPEIRPLALRWITPALRP